MKKQLYTYEVEIEDSDYTDDGAGFGAFIVGDVTYYLEDVIEVNTPFGAKIGQTVVIHEIGDAIKFVSDRDGGELYDTEDDLLEYLTEEEMRDQIQDWLNRGGNPS